MNDSSFWRINVCNEFSAAHALNNYQGKCERKHGHNFKVEVCAEGDEIDADTGLLIDFKLLKTILKEVLGELDHQDLNALPLLKGQSPSSENISRYIFQEIQQRLECCPALKDTRIKLVSVKLSEKEGQSDTYFCGCRQKFYN